MEEVPVLKKEWLQTLIRKRYPGLDPFLPPEVVKAPYSQLFPLFSFQKFSLSLVGYLLESKTSLT